MAKNMQTYWYNKAKHVMLEYLVQKRDTHERNDNVDGYIALKCLIDQLENLNIVHDEVM